MSEYDAPLRDMRFILTELAGLEQVAALPECAAASPDMVDAVLEEAARFASGVLAPLNTVGDRQGCRLQDGEVISPDGWDQAYRQFCDAGWAGLGMPTEFGGQALPKLVAAPVNEIWYAANMAFALLPPMALGAVETLMRAASPELKERYIPRMASGEWAATMDLTESQAGSDLGAIKTRAVPHEDGSHRLFGQKIFITGGEHTLADNIVHLVLARLPDAPPGVRGISLFLVPKFLVNADGSLGARNDMRCVAVEHKMGIRGSPTCAMSYGDADGAVGYLVGEPNRGLEYMFVLVNESRFNVGMQGIAVAERAYQKALAYARERRQGRDAVSGEPNVEIFRHPDVRRMLLQMRANIMAARMLAYVAAAWFDRGRCDPDQQAAQHCQQLVDLMMPVVKGWSTELGIECADLGLQIHGGMGFIEETGAAQYLRDLRITSIYEGTTAIQANDLILRKILRDQGAALRTLLGEIDAVARQAREHPQAAAQGAALQGMLASLEQALAWILAQDKSRLGAVLAGGVAFLHLLGMTCGGWQMARAALAALVCLQAGRGDADYQHGLLELSAFYFGQYAPRAPALAATLIDGGDSVMACSERAF